jgi:hypothetical protein
MALWMLNWLTTGTCGLVMVLIFTFFVCFMSNASEAYWSFETMPAFYKYGHAKPFYHTSRATRTIMLGMKSHLKVCFAMLLGWCVAGWCRPLGLATWRVRMGKKGGVHIVP